MPASSPLRLRRLRITALSATLAMSTVVVLAAVLAPHGVSLWPETSRSAVAQSRKGSGGAADREKQIEDALRRESLRVATVYSKDLDKIAASAGKQGLIKQGRALYTRIKRLDPEYEGLPELRKKLTDVKKPDPEKDLSNAQRTFERRLKTADANQAKRLYGFAGQCFKYGLFTRAYELLHQVLDTVEDPSNTHVKKAMDHLGFEWNRKEKRWVREWEVQRLKKHFLTDEGWFEKKHKRDFDKGLRPWTEKKWIPAKEEHEKRSRNAYNPYRVTGEYFAILTTKSRKVAWEYSQILDSFKREFYKVFIGYYDQDKGGKLLFELGKNDLHRVYVFPSRIDYLQHIKEKQGNEKLLRDSAGFYASDEQISRFYWSENPEQTYHTLFHEVAHQLFDETKEVRGHSVANNWVVEGLAVYVETWAYSRKRDAWKAGHKIDNNRMTYARRILAKDDGLFELSKFVTIDNKQFHEGDGRGANYALSGALVHFLMHYDDEVYKEDFMRFVSDFYGGRIKSEHALVAYLGVDFETLEEQFREYMRFLLRKPGKRSGKSSGKTTVKERRQR